MKRQILVKVWQKRLTPEQALEELVRAGPLHPGKRERTLIILSAVEGREITVNEAEQELGEEGMYECGRKRKTGDHSLCQI